MIARRTRLIAVVALGWLLGSPALANEPCPPPPCRSGDPLDPAFEPERCLAKATWVAVGRITQLEQRDAGDKDGKEAPKHLASFTLKIVSWDKGQVEGVTRIPLTVGVCNRVLPDKTSGLWRFYGVGTLEPDAGPAAKQQPPPTGDRPRYLDFVRYREGD